MLEIDRKYNMKLTRGDTAYINISLEDEDETTYEFVEGDTMFFRLAANIFVEKELSIDFSENIATLTLEPEDTEGLMYETYKYEIELITSTGEHFTVIPNRSFTVDYEVEVHNGN